MLVRSASPSLVNVRVVRFVQHRNVQVCSTSGVAFTTQECASASLVNVRVVRNVQVLVWSMCEWSNYNVQVCTTLVWSMCEWSGLYNTGMCEC